MPTPTILVATDLTARSDRPLDRAALLAEQIGAGVAVAHVVEGPGFDRDHDEEILHAVRASLPSTLAGATVISDHGAAPKVLAALAAGPGAALLATGVAADGQGRVFVANGQIFVYAPDGRQIGQIDVPERPLQLVVGGADRQTLFILTHHALYGLALR